MKSNTIKHTGIVVVIILTMLIICTEVVSNTWFLLTHNAYFIPGESSIFTFKVTQMNEGSGEWWLYGEDHTFYYGLNIEPDYTSRYFKQKKGAEPDLFNKNNYKTWSIE